MRASGVVWFGSIYVMCHILALILIQVVFERRGDILIPNMIWLSGCSIPSSEFSIAQTAAGDDLQCPHMDNEWSLDHHASRSVASAAPG